MDTRRTRYRCSRGRWAVERERGQIEDPAPPVEAAPVLRLGEALPAVMKRLGLAEPHWLNVLEEEWPRLVGQAVARHTRPGRYERQAVTVFVDGSVWLSELSRYGRREMLANLQKRFGADRIRGVNLCLDPDGSGGKRPGR